jgi:hypothetical protein
MGSMGQQHAHGGLLGGRELLASSGAVEQIQGAGNRLRMPLAAPSWLASALRPLTTKDALYRPSFWPDNIEHIRHRYPEDLGKKVTNLF